MATACSAQSAGSMGFRSRSAWIPPAALVPWSKEDAHVLGEQHVLVEDELAARDLPRAVDAPQDVGPRADVEILLDLRSASIHEEVGADRDLRRRVARLHLDVDDEVARA